MNEKEFKEELERLKELNKQLEYKNKLMVEKNKYKKTHFSTSKFVMFLVFAINIEILVFAQVLMLITQDTSALYSLIAIPTTLVPTVIAYYVKSSKENSVGGITYDTAMREYESEG